MCEGIGRDRQRDEALCSEVKEFEGWQPSKSPHSSLMSCGIGSRPPRAPGNGLTPNQCSPIGERPVARIVRDPSFPSLTHPDQPTALRVMQVSEAFAQSVGCSHWKQRGVTRMFLTLLVVTFLIAIATSALVASLFSRPVKKVLDRLVSDDLGSTWRRYIIFAVYVVGISGGVRVWDLERYITPRTKDDLPIALNSDRWVLEVYKTIVGTLQSIAWMLLVFFLFALLAYVVVRGFELRREKG